jgi:hypothetical protein
MILNDIQNGNFHDTRVCLVYCYLGFRNDLEQTVNVLGSLLTQVLDAISSVDFREEIIQSLHDKLQESSQSRLNLEEAHQFLLKALRECERAYICIDGLDECSETTSLLVSLNNLAGDMVDRNQSVRLFFAARPLVDRSVSNMTRLDSVVEMSWEADEQDIVVYVSDQLETDGKEDCMNDSLRRRIIDKIAHHCDGMYVMNPFILSSVPCAFIN